MKGITEYSKKIPGAPGNFQWPVNFDLTDGFLGIDQEHPSAGDERVLLCPRQVAALLEFLREKKSGLLHPPAPKTITLAQARRIALTSLKQAERARKAGLLRRPR